MTSIYPFYRVFDDKGEQYCDVGGKNTHKREFLQIEDFLTEE